MYLSINIPSSWPAGHDGVCGNILDCLCGRHWKCISEYLMVQQNKCIRRKSLTEWAFVSSRIRLLGWSHLLFSTHWSAHQSPCSSWSWRTWRSNRIICGRRSIIRFVRTTRIIRSVRMARGYGSIVRFGGTTRTRTHGSIVGGIVTFLDVSVFDAFGTCFQ